MEIELKERACKECCDNYNKLGRGTFHFCKNCSYILDKAYDSFFNIFFQPELSKREDLNCFMDCQAAMCDGWDNCICGDHTSCIIEIQCSNHGGNNQ